MLSLQLFGGCSLHDDGTPLAGPVAQRRRLALLAVIASSHSIGVSRDKLIGYFWPEEDRERARHFLADSLFTIRKGLGKDVILAVGDDLRLNPDLVRADVREFEDLHRRGETAAAVALYRGPFLDGFFIADAPEFERWADAERQRLAAIHSASLENLADESEKRGDYLSAAEWWKRLAAHDPYSARVALRTMKALERSGDSAAAVQHAAKYERMVRDDLELPPDAAVMMLAAHLRSGSGSSAVRAPLVIANMQAPPHSVTEQSKPPGANPKAVTSHRGSSRRLAAITVAAVAILAVLVAALQANRKPRSEPIASAGSPAPGAGFSGSTDRANPARSEAEDLYNQGRALTENASESGDFAQAVMYFERAILRDPTFVKAYAGMADAYSQGNDPVRAKQRVATALARDSTMPEAHAAMGYILGFYEHRWLAADSAVERATRLSPSFTLAHLRRASINAVLGRADVAMASLERARQLEPNSWTVLYNRGLVASALGRPKEAIRHFQGAVALRPDRRDLKYSLANELWLDGRIAESAALYRSIGFLNSALIAEGDTSEVRRLVRRHEADSVQMHPTILARHYVRLGERDKAFRALKEAVKKDRFLPMQIRVAPLVWLKDDRRYARVMADLGLQHTR